MARLRDEGMETRIIRSAMDVFGEQGFQATTLKDIAAGAGISTGSIYTYFKDKEALFQATVLYGLGQLQCGAGSPRRLRCGAGGATFPPSRQRFCRAHPGPPSPQGHAVRRGQTTSGRTAARTRDRLHRQTPESRSRTERGGRGRSIPFPILCRGSLGNGTGAEAEAGTHPHPDHRNTFQRGPRRTRGGRRHARQSSLRGRLFSQIRSKFRSIGAARRLGRED